MLEEGLASAPPKCMSCFEKLFKNNNKKKEFSHIERKKTLVTLVISCFFCPSDYSQTSLFCPYVLIS